jgi:predicted PurR-regulated permease PerM
MLRRFLMAAPPLTDRRFLIAAWILAGVSLFLILRLHLLLALLVGLLVHELVHLLAPRLPRRFFDRRAKAAAVVLIVGVSVTVVAALVIGAVAFFRSDAGSLANLLTRMALIIDGARGYLPPWLVVRLPADADAINRVVSDWLRENAYEVGTVGKEASRAFAQLFGGLVIGAMISLHELRVGDAYPPFASALIERARRLAGAFRSIVFAQIKVSGTNAVFTAVYLAIALPLFGVHLPFVKTMIAVTFVAGLLPIIGNLISNTVIVVVSLAHSPQLAVASLAFLVVIHKLEYFLNARIVGGQINSRAWELLLAMLVMEAAFGLPGVVAAPVFYAYLKDEMRAAGLV